MTQEELDEILDLHQRWLNGDPDGRRAILRNCDLSGCNMSDYDMQSIKLHNCNLSNCIMRNCDMRFCIIHKCNLSNSDMRGVDMSDSDMHGCIMYNCDMRHCIMHNCNLSNCDLTNCDMRGCDISGARGLLSPIEYIDNAFKRTPDGYVAYKTFGVSRESPMNWNIQPRAIIQENCNMNRSDSCGSGINVAPLKWVKRVYHDYDVPIWKVLIRWEWLPGVCVPYNTDGKIRCERVQLLEVVDR